jgi:uncharacterized membrane protein YdfJ with MMPL/SSD domain
MASVSAAAEGVVRGQAQLGGLERAMAGFADVFEAAAEGRPAFFSWRRLIAGTQAEGTRHAALRPRPTGAGLRGLEPGAAASAAVRAAARELNLDADHGVRLRLTGPVPLADEEFATLADDAALTTSVMVLALLAVLWAGGALRRFVAAIVATTLLGLAVTTGLGLLAVGRLNLISVAFIPLFVGLGVDFAIQVCVRCRAQRLAQPRLEDALVATGAGLGRPLTLAALAVAAGFFASCRPATWACPNSARSRASA